MGAEFLKHSGAEIEAPHVVSELGIAKPELMERLLRGEVRIPLQGVELEEHLIPGED